MAPHERQQTSVTRVALSVMIIMAGIFACTGVTIFGIDAACNEYIDRWAPIYPEATQVELEYDFIRPRGMGNTYMVLETNDPLLEVNSWYIDRRAEAGRSEGIGQAGFQVEPTDDGDGTIIRLYSTCAWT